MTKQKEKEKYEICYQDPEYKLGKYRYADTINDITDIINEHGPIHTHLDVSCGRGEVIDHVKSLGVNSSGTEIVDALVKNRSDVQFAWSDQLPFADNSVQFLTNTDAMEHYLPELTKPILDEFFRVCSHVAYFTISNKRATKHEMELHINIKSYDEWQDILSKYR